MKKIDWNKVEDAKEFPRPTPGGYIGKICRVEDKEEREFLTIEWDFCEGPLTGSNKDCYLRNDFWPLRFVRSYKTSALSFFKAFKTALEESNPGYRFNEDDLDGMVGKTLGIVLGEEETFNNGRVKVRLVVREVRSVDSIRKGAFTTPPLKPLKTLSKTESQASYPQHLPDDTPLPWDDPLPL